MAVAEANKDKVVTLGRLEHFYQKLRTVFEAKESDEPIGEDVITDEDIDSIFDEPDPNENTGSQDPPAGGEG